jgi:hypothetical protein
VYEFSATYYCHQSKTLSLHHSLSSSTLKLGSNLTAIANDRACFLAWHLVSVSEETPRHSRATLASQPPLLAYLTVQDHQLTRTAT